MFDTFFSPFGLLNLHTFSLGLSKGLGCERSSNQIKRSAKVVSRRAKLSGYCCFFFHPRKISFPLTKITEIQS
jgi:hypothetical protein